MSFNPGKVRARVLGAPIDAVNWLRCLDSIVTWASRRESRYVCMCNVHSIVTARLDPKFRWVVSRADIAAPDGAPVAWRLRRMGHGGQERINGPDLMWRCCVRAAGVGLRVFLYGGTPDTLERLRERLATELPELQLAGWHAPPFRTLTEEEDEEEVRMINESGAHIVFVALGCPKQEAWMAAHRDRVRAVMIGVGAAFDYHAGVLPRAPRWMRNAGLEWLHRLVSEPRRLWRRYLVTNTLFCAYLLGEFVRDAGARRNQR